MNPGITALDLDSLQESIGPGSDAIDHFYTGKMWDEGLPGGPFKVGRVVSAAEYAQVTGQIQATKRGLYIVKTTDKRYVPDCYLLSPMAYRVSTSGSGKQFAPDRVPGQYSKPYPGALCVIGTAQGGTAFILGFWNPPSTIATDGDEYTNETTPGMVDDKDARTAGDWVVRTENAVLNIKRGGSLVIESGATIRHTLNPDNGAYFTQSKSRIDVVEGYKLTRSRLSDTERETLSTEDCFDKILQRGQTATRIRVQNGYVTSEIKHEMSIAEVNYATITDPIVTVKARERYLDDGKWIAEGPEYRWGGSSADQQLVLGNELVSIIKKLTSLIRSIKVMTAWGTSSPPLNAISFTTDIDQKLDSILSDYMYITKKSVRP